MQKLHTCLCKMTHTVITIMPHIFFNVLMDNNVSCKMIGMDIVEMPIHDDMVWTLTDVWYISRLRKGCEY